MSLLMTFLLFFQSVSSQFSLRSGFSDAFNQKFSNLSNASQIKNALSALLNVIAPSIKNSSGYKMPFELNCTVAFDAEVEKIDCDTNFRNVHLINESCQAEPLLPSQNSNLLQARMIVGLVPGGRPQVMYWLRPKRTESLSQTFTKSLKQNYPIPPTTGLLAAWNAAAGVYADTTNQTGRYTASNGVVTDTLTQMQWEQTAGTSTMAWSSISSYCSGRTTGGLSGWRAPNIVELGTLVDYTIAYSTPPQINLVAFSGAPASDFWSASSDIGNSGNSWFLRSSSDSVSYYQTTGTTSPVRCIRSSYPTSPSSRYTVGTGASTGTVIDNVTGLIWQKVAPTTGGPNNDGTYIQSGAASYCSSLSLGGFNSGWRLPSVRELQTLVDYSVSQGSLMMDSVFTGEPGSYFWSSTPVAGGPSNAWFVTFGGGVVDGYDVAISHYVRCVQ